MRPETIAVVVILALLAAAVGAVAAAMNRPPGRVTVGVAALAGAAVVVQSVVAVVALVRGEGPDGVATVVGYLVGIVFVFPLAIGWALVERTRWSGLVLSVAGLAVAVMTARIDQLWRGVGG